MSADLFEAFGGSLNTQAEPSTFQPASKQNNAMQRVHDHSPVKGNGLRPEPLWQPRQEGNDVLFDATDEEQQDDGDDDFGDFEDADQTEEPNLQPGSHTRAAKPVPSAPAAGLIDLLSLDDTPAQPFVPKIGSSTLSNATASVNPSPSAKLVPEAAVDDAWGDFESASQDAITPGVQAAAERAQPRYHNTNAPPHDDGSFEWDAFDDAFEDADVPPSAPTATAASVLTLKSAAATSPEEAVATNDIENASDDDEWTTFDEEPPQTTSAPASSPTKSAVPANAARPTNVPPPSTLFSWITCIYSTLSSAPPSANTIVSIHRLTARLLAGRSQRWRRDTLLSQSLRISDTTSGAKQGGMKLSSLSKSETQRESREASEVVAAWNVLVPKFLTILRKQDVKPPAGKGLRLSDPLAVKVLKNSEGGMDAGYICPVCGLKRNERVVGVDDAGVEDIFGEFWRDGWGHSDCAEGWYGYHELLSQR